MVKVLIVILLLSLIALVIYLLWLFVTDEAKEKMYDEIVFGKGCRKRWRKERRKEFIQKLKRIFS